MKARRRFAGKRAALLLFASLLFTIFFPFGTRGRIYAQEPSQPAARERRATEAPRASAQEDDEEIVEVESSLVNLLFTAVDKEKRFVTELKREDVRVLEDGRPQELFVFERQTELPLALTLLVDTSRSQEFTLPAAKTAATGFLEAIVRPDKDEVAVVSFSGSAISEQDMTNDIARVRAAIERIKIVLPPDEDDEGIVVAQDPNVPPLGSTAIWDAIIATCDDLTPRLKSTGRPQLRRAIILLSDGEDSTSRMMIEDAIETAIRSDTIIYSIGVESKKYGIDRKALRKIAESTGGRAFFPVDDTTLRAAFGQIAQELRSQYIAAYSPTNRARDGKLRQVLIEITNKDLRKRKLRLTYRQGYYAAIK